MNVADACFATVHDAGPDLLGVRLGKLGTTLSNEVKPRTAAEIQAMKESGRTVPKFGLLDAVKVMQFSNDLRILNAAAAELGCMVVRLPDTGEDGPAAAEVADVAIKFGELMRGVARSLGDGRITNRELSQVEREAGQLVATVQRLLVSLGRMNAALCAMAPGAAK